MNKLCVVLLAVLSPFSGTRWTAQEVKHAPTVEQCKIEWALSRQVENGMPGYIALPYPKLLDWEAEMVDCATVADPQEKDGYKMAANFALMEMARRPMRFLQRHNLYQQFLDEDLAGKR